MRLASEVGLTVAPVSLERVARKDVLLVERFDRVKTKDRWSRKAIVSSLTRRSRMLQFIAIFPPEIRKIRI